MGHAQMGRVSVIVPNYNRDPLIAETINNLLSQTLPPQEIIVVDDGSTDASVKTIRSFGPRVKLIQQSNQGPGAARNAGLAIAGGEYIQFQDSDDLLSLNKFEGQARQLAETGSDIAFGPWAHVSIRERQMAFETCVLQQSLPPKRIGLLEWQMRGWSTVFQSLLFRRTFLDSVGKYRTDVRYGEDMEFFFRLLSLSPRIAFAGEGLTLYRVDAPNKLSSDAGLARNRRVVDWANCLQSMIDERKKRGLQQDFWTRCIFRTGIRKHLRYLKKVPDAPARLIQSLIAEVQKCPGALLAGVELWLRFVERVRLFRTGYRWMPGYRSAPATPGQIKLVHDLGFGVCPPLVRNN